MHTRIKDLLGGLWQTYLATTPSAKKIHALLSSNKPIVNDHIALRTFNIPTIGLPILAEHFLSLGYQLAGEYHFKQKKLYAQHFEPVKPNLPKVFISELLLEECSYELQQTVKKLVFNLTPSKIHADNFLYSGRHWDISYQDYQLLLKESEYAAWLAVWGYRANHFTVSVNHLSDYENLEQVNLALKQAGFELNQSGGEIKGSKADLLQQSSTLADKVNVEFVDGVYEVPSCFYEFALRYRQADGSLFSGFVAASADKIFDSTNSR